MEFPETTREQAIERAKKYNLEAEVIEFINMGYSPAEACFEWDV